MKPLLRTVTSEDQSPPVSVLKFLRLLYPFVLSVYLLSLKVKWSESESGSVVSDSLRPYGLHSPWNSPGQNTGVGSLSLLQGIFPTQGSNLGLPHCRRILLPAEPQGKPKNTGMGSLSFLQWILPTQESNQGLLHRRRIPYQLSYKGSPLSLFNCPFRHLCPLFLFPALLTIRSGTWHLTGKTWTPVTLASASCCHTGCQPSNRANETGDEAEFSRSVIWPVSFFFPVLLK